MNNVEFMEKLLVNRKSSENMVLSSLLLSYREDIPVILPKFYKKEQVSDVASRVTLAIPQIGFFRKNGELERIGVVISEMVYYVDPEGKPIDSPDYARQTNQYYALTKIERVLHHNRKQLEMAHESIPANLLDVPSEYPLPISEFYSDILEDYIYEGSSYKSTSPLNSFLDVAYPVIEREQYTLLRKCTVDTITEHLNDWVQLLVDNKLSEETSNIIKEEIGNYFKMSNSVFSTLSAAKRGKNVATSDLLRSCPEYAHKKEFLLTEANDPALRVSPAFRRLPLFNKQFMSNFLFGYVPLCLVFTEAITEETIEYDIFKSLKTVFLQKLEDIVQELAHELPNGEVKQVICSNNSGFISVPMGRLYENSIKPGFKGMKGFSGIKYNCLMVDYLMYAEVLKKQGIAVENMRMLDFIAQIAPFDIKY